MFHGNARTVHRAERDREVRERERGGELLYRYVYKTLQVSSFAFIFLGREGRW